jgi:hypothetical protein
MSLPQWKVSPEVGFKIIRYRGQRDGYAVGEFATGTDVVHNTSGHAVSKGSLKSDINVSPRRLPTTICHRSMFYIGVKAEGSIGYIRAAVSDML